MIPALATKLVSITPPAAIVDDASYTTAAVDTLGYDYCTITAYLGATDVDMTALKVQESDDDGSSDPYADVTGLVASGTTGDERLPQDDDDNKFFRFFIDLRGRKRYLDLVATAGNGAAGTFLTAWAELSRAKEGPQTTTEQGLAGRFIV